MNTPANQLTDALQELRSKTAMVESAAELEALTAREKIDGLNEDLCHAWLERDEAKAKLEQEIKAREVMEQRFREANEALRVDLELARIAQLGRKERAAARARAMIDLETLGTRPGSVIVAIGAVRFGGGKILDRFYAVIDPQDAQACGLTIDAGTVLWWLGQSDEARKEIAFGGKPLAAVLTSFAAWLGDDRETEVWGNGASFDCALLAEAYVRCGLPRPWRYPNERCYRTVKELHPEVELKRQGTHHNAADDAESQALHLMAMGVGAA